MTEYSSFLMIPALISGVLFLLTILLYKWTFKSKRKSLWIGLSVFLVCYTLIVGSAALIDIKYQKQLDTYDLNQDGLFSGNEITPEQEAVMFRLTNDAGRNFSIFTGAFFSGILGLIAYGISVGIRKYNRLKIEEKN